MAMAIYCFMIDGGSEKRVRKLDEDPVVARRQG